MGQQRVWGEDRGEATVVVGRCLNDHLVGGAGPGAEVLLDVAELILKTSALWKMREKFRRLVSRTA